MKNNYILLTESGYGYSPYCPDNESNEPKTINFYTINECAKIINESEVQDIIIAKVEILELK